MTFHLPRLKIIIINKEGFPEASIRKQKVILIINYFIIKSFSKHCIQFEEKVIILQKSFTKKIYV